jgi:hypothetical protein
LHGYGLRQRMRADGKYAYHQLRMSWTPQRRDIALSTTAHLSRQLRAAPYLADE